MPLYFHMRNNLEDVDQMVLSLKDVAGTFLDHSAMFRFEICVSEALTNIVKHAAATDKNEAILIQLEKAQTALNVAIFDPLGAAPFDLRDHAPSLDDVDPFAESGRGIGLIQQCADRVNYGTEDGRTRLTLTFNKSGEF